MSDNDQDDKIADAIAGAAQGVSTRWNCPPVPVTLELPLSDEIGPDTAPVQAFEYALADYVGRKYCVATLTGTAALHVAMVVAGVRELDRVVVPAVGYVAAANAVRYCGGTPVFVDVSDDAQASERLLLDALLRERPRAVVVQHLFGTGVSTERLHARCCEKGSVLINDVCQSLGARFGSRHVGTVGAMTVLSFAANKIITCGQGGAVLTDDPDVAQRLRDLVRMGARRHIGIYETSDYLEVGYNYGMSGITATLGMQQLTQIGPRLTERHERYARYVTALEAFSEVRAIKHWAGSAYWALAIELTSEGHRRYLARALNERGVPTRSLWRATHRTAAHWCCDDLPVARWLAERVLLLPCA